MTEDRPHREGPVSKESLANALLSDDSILELIPGYDIVELGDGRLLVRHRGGYFLLPGLEREELQSILSVVDGQSTVGQIAKAVAERFEIDDVRLVLRALWGDVVRCRPAREFEESTSMARLHIVGTGSLADRLAAELPALGLEVQRRSWGDQVPSVEDDESAEAQSEDLANIWLLVGENVDYGSLLRWQRQISRHSLSQTPRQETRQTTRAFCVTAEPDGVRLGPWLQPEGPCLVCARRHEMPFLAGLESPLEVFESLRCDSVGPLLDAASSAVVSQLRRALFVREEASSAMLRLTASGELLRSKLERWPDCPVCSPSVSTESELSPVDDPPPKIKASSMETETAAPECGPIRRVGIVGGGTAGYLAALAFRRFHSGIEVTLIEARDLPIIGVGEATTPLMPQFLHVDLGLSVHRLFHEVRPTLKQGIRFHWGPGGTSRFNFPFGPMDLSAPERLLSDLDRVSPRAVAMTANRLAACRSASRASARSDALDALMDPWLAYHLDNRPFVEYLRRRARARGIRSVDAHIVDVEVGTDGSVAGLLARDGRRFEFDLYVDCSGFASLLMGGSQDSPFVDFAASLPTDRALVGATNIDGEIRPYTLATAMSAGWCWSTPQRDTDHRGYVYSSAFMDAERAEREMREQIPTLGEVREVRFRAGRRQHFWRRNVVALGNAYGFVEPLESTALHMLIRQIGLLVAALPARRVAKDLFNRRVAGWWDYLRWFLALHFRFNGAWETEFWRYCREHSDVSAYAELIEAFQRVGPLSLQRPRSLVDLPDPLWGLEGIDVLLLGQGMPWPSVPTTEGAVSSKVIRGKQSAIRSEELPGQRQWLDQLSRHPEALDSWLRTLKAVGPAFPG